MEPRLGQSEMNHINLSWLIELKYLGYFYCCKMPCVFLFQHPLSLPLTCWDGKPHIETVSAADVSR